MGVSSLWHWVSATLPPIRPVHLSGPEVIFKTFVRPPKRYYVVKTTIQKQFPTREIITTHKKNILSVTPQTLEEAAFASLTSSFDPEKYTTYFQNKIDRLSRVNFFNYLEDAKAKSNLRHSAARHTDKYFVRRRMFKAHKVPGINRSALERWKEKLSDYEDFYVNNFKRDGKWESDFLEPLGLRPGFE